MVSETFVMLTKMALEIQPPFTYVFICPWSCILELKQNKQNTNKIQTNKAFSELHTMSFTQFVRRIPLGSASPHLFQVECRIPSMTVDTTFGRLYVLITQ